MLVALLIVHLLVCLALIMVVLLQSGKGGGLAGAFGGGGGSQALFGGRGAATFLSKATTILGSAFMLTSLSLALLSGAHDASSPESLMRRAQQEPEAPQPLPFTPGETPGAVPRPEESGSTLPPGVTPPTQSQPPAQSPASTPANAPATGTQTPATGR